MNKTWLIWSILCLATHLVSGQTPYHEKIQFNDIGINSIYNLLVDKEGVLYAGTNDGIIKYDGYQTQKIKPDKASTFNFSTLQQSSAGVIYTQNFNGELFYLQGNTMIREKRLPTSNGFYPCHIYKDILIFFKSDTIFELNLVTGKLQTWPQAQSVFEVTTVIKDHLIFLNNSHDLVMKPLGSDKIKNIVHLNTVIHFLVNDGNSLFGFGKENSGLAYVFKQKEGLKNAATGISTRINHVNVIDNKIWVLTTNGAYCFDSRLNSLFPKGIFTQYNITDVRKDENEVFWLSTMTGSLLKVYGLVSKMIWSDKTEINHAAYYKNAIYITNPASEVYKYNLATDSLSLFYSGNETCQRGFLYFDSTNGLTFYLTHRLHVLQDGKLVYLQKEQGSIYKFIDKVGKNAYLAAGKNTVQLITYTHDFSFPSWLKPEQIYEKGPFKFYTVDVRLKRNTLVLYFENKDYYLLFSTDGLEYCSAEGSFQVTDQGKPIIPVSYLRYKDYVIIFTSTNGVYVIQGRKIIRHYMLKDNLKDVFNGHIYKDNVYLTNNNDIFIYSLKDQTLKKHRYLRSSPYNRFNDLQVFDDQIFLYSPDKVSQIPIYTGQKLTVQPQLIIDSLLVNGHKWNLKTNISLPHDKNNLELFYHISHASGVNGLKVEYHLNNIFYQQKYEEKRSIVLSALAPNDYIISLKALNDRGFESASQEFNIEISPAFYRTWKFYSLIVAALALIGFFVFRNREKSIIRNKNREIEKQQLRNDLHLSSLKTLRSQMNPHFFFNALNTVQGLIYSGDKEKASVLLSHFADLSRSLLDSVDELSIPIEKEIELIKSYLSIEHLRTPHFLYNIFTCVNVDVYDTMIPAMIIQPLVENAIKHGLAHKDGEGKIVIRFFMHESYLVCQVEDDGIGRKNSAEINKNLHRHTSFSTSALEERIKILNTDSPQKILFTITDMEKSTGETGTLVEVKFPMLKTDE